MAPGFQPYLHDVVTCVRAPTAVAVRRVTGRSGAGGAHGLLHAETRFVCELVVDDRRPGADADRHHALDGGEARFVAAVIGVGDEIPDPTVRLVTRRTVGPARHA